MGDMPIIFVNNTGHTISTIGTIHAILTLRRFHGKPIFPVFSIHSDRAIFPIDGNSWAIFARHTDGTVYTIFAFFTQIQLVIDIDLVRIFRCACACNCRIFPICQFSSILGNFILQLADIHSIRSSSAGSHIVNLVATIIQPIFCQRNWRSPWCQIFRRDRNTPSTNRCLIPIFIRDSHAASLCHSLISVCVGGRHTVHVQIIVQDHFHRSVFHFRRNIFAVPGNFNILSQRFVDDISILIL